MSYENSRYKNIGNDEGDVLNFFGNLRNLIQKNGGDNTFSSYTEDFHEKTIPFYTGEKTKLMLTHPNHTISQIEKGFIEMTVEFQVGFEDPLLMKDFKIKEIEHKFVADEDLQNEVKKLTKAFNTSIKNYDEDTIKPRENEFQNQVEDIINHIEGYCETNGDNLNNLKQQVINNRADLFKAFNGCDELNPAHMERQVFDRTTDLAYTKYADAHPVVRALNDDIQLLAAGDFNDVNVDIQWTGDLLHFYKNKYIDSININRIFIGFKDAVEIISECRFYVNGKLIDEYNNQDMIRESFAYNSIRTRENKISSPYSHSLWENVSQMSPNVCGVYIPLREFIHDDDENENKTKFVNVKLELLIPFTDQLALQAWRLYPNRILGEIEEEIVTSLNGLVWCQLQPKIVGEKLKDKYYVLDGEYNAPYITLDNCFNQINDIGYVVNHIEYDTVVKDFQCHYMFQDKASYTYPKLNKQYFINYEVCQNRLLLNTNFRPKITLGRTNCFGFGLKQDVTESLVVILRTPLIIPSQELTRYIFEQTVTNKEINVRRFVPLRNATNITMMFPTTNNQCTVFKNIYHENVQLTIDKRLYPHLAFENTWNGRFVQYQLMANELDGTEATKEYLDSISIPYTDNYSKYYKASVPIIYRNKTNKSDNTSFGINFQLERGNSGYVFDGLDTDSRDVEIQFKAKFNHKPGQNIIENPYYYPIIDIKNKDLNTTLIEKPPNPEMWICSDTYWIWSLEEGVQYRQNGIPEGYA